MNANRFAVAAVVLVASAAFAQFRFDPSTGTCRNAAGSIGLNAGVVGPCGDFRGANLEGARLESMDLRGANFDGANLKGASLLGSELTRASFRAADLSKASLRAARLSAAQLTGAKLMGAQLEAATLDGATLSDADLRNACLFRTRFEGANVRGAHFSQARALVANARWSGVIADVDTLPFTTAELVSMNVQLSQVASR